MNAYTVNYLCNASSLNISDHCHQYTVMASHWYEFPKNNHFDRLSLRQKAIFLKLYNSELLLTPATDFISDLFYLDMGQTPALLVCPFLQKHPTPLSECLKFLFQKMQVKFALLLAYCLHAPEINISSANAIGMTLVSLPRTFIQSGLQRSLSM